MKKQLLLLVLIILPLVASAHDIEVQNTDGVTIYYNYTNDSTELEVTFRGSSYKVYSDRYKGNVVIPEEVTIENRTRKVTSIGDDAFFGCTGLTSNTIPNSVTSIDSKAFYGCSGLTSVTIGNSVTSIGNEAFFGCSALKKVIVSDIAAWCGIKFGDKPLYYAKHLYSDENTEITDLVIPNSVTSISDYAFCDCSGLTSVTIGNNVTSIGHRAFSGCSGLTSVAIGNNVRSIDVEAFFGCTGLTSITIPNSVTRFNRSAFDGCSSLSSIEVGSGNTMYDSRNNCNAIIETASNTLVFGCKSTVIPNSVTSIGSEAFYGCSGLTSITIPNSVTSISSEAFFGCSGLTSVTIGNNVTSIGNSAFYNCSALTSITISNSVTSIGANAFLGSGWYNKQNDGILYLCNWLLGYKGNRPTGDLKIVNGTKGIEDGAFSRCYRLTSITIPNSVTSIGSSAFSGCYRLASIEVEAGNTMYDSRNNCNAIIETASNTLVFGCKSTVIPNSVTNIGSYAFYDCTDLTSITIPNSVTSIGSYAFYNCSGLTSVTIGNNVTSIGLCAFYNCSGLTSVTISNSVTTIDSSAFYKCSSLTSVIIPNSVTCIGSYAFYNCSGLTSVTIPNSVTSIGVNAFLGSGWYNKQNDGILYLCNWLLGYKGNKPTGDLEIVNGTKGIGDDAFWNCSGLTSITIPNSVTSIGEYAFKSCSGLTSIAIPNNVTTIGNNAFGGCSGLKKVIISDIASWCGIEFGRYSESNTIGINNGMYYANPLCYANHLYSDENTEIKNLIIPNSVTSISHNAFNGCSGLTSVTIGNNVTSIGNSAFTNCSGLTSVTIPNSVTSICKWAFSGCSSLTSVTIPNSVTSIGETAFSYCSGLISVTIGKSVISIGEGAFRGVDIPTVISLIKSPFAIESKTSLERPFTYNTFVNATLYVPKGTIDKYKATEGWKDFVHIEEGVPTGINVVENTKYNNTTIYDLTGVRQPEPKKGINIVNGKKVVVK